MKQQVITRSTGKFCSQVNHIFNAVNTKWLNITSIVFNTAFDLYNSSLEDPLNSDIKSTYESLVTSKFKPGNDLFWAGENFKPWYSKYLIELFELLNQDNFILLLNELVRETDFHPDLDAVKRNEWRQIITTDLNIQKLIQTLKNKIKLQSSNHKNSKYNSEEDTWFPISIINNRFYDLNIETANDWDIIRNLKTNKAGILRKLTDWDFDVTTLEFDYDDYKTTIKWTDTNYLLFNCNYGLIFLNNKTWEQLGWTIAWDNIPNIEKYVSTKIINWQEYILYWYWDNHLLIDLPSEEVLHLYYKDYCIVDNNLYLKEDNRSQENDLLTALSTNCHIMQSDNSEWDIIWILESCSSKLIIYNKKTEKILKRYNTQLENFWDMTYNKLNKIVTWEIEFLEDWKEQIAF